MKETDQNSKKTSESKQNGDNKQEKSSSDNNKKETAQTGKEKPKKATEDKPKKVSDEKTKIPAEDKPKKPVAEEKPKKPVTEEKAKNDAVNSRKIIEKHAEKAENGSGSKSPHKEVNFVQPEAGKEQPKTKDKVNKEHKGSPAKGASTETKTESEESKIDEILLTNKQCHLLSMIFLHLEPEDWINCEQVCVAWRDYFVKWFYVQPHLQAIVREKVVAYIWTTKTPIQTEIRLPKEFKSAEANLLLIDRNEMIFYNRHKYVIYDRHTFKRSKVHKFSVKAPKTASEKASRSMQLKIVGDYIIGLLRFHVQVYQVCVWKKKSGYRVQFQDICETDAQVDLYLSEDRSLITIDCYFSAFVFAFDREKGTFTKHYEVLDKFTVWPQPQNFILSCEKPGEYQLHHTGLKKVVHCISNIEMDHVITVKKKCNTVLFAGYHEEKRSSKDKYFFIIVNLLTGAKMRSENTASYFVDIPDSDMLKTSDDIVFVPHRTGWDVNNFFAGDLSEIRHSKDTNSGRIMHSLFVGGDGKLAVLLREGKRDIDGTYGNAIKTVVNLGKYPEGQIMLAEIPQRIHIQRIVADESALVVIPMEVVEGEDKIVENVIMYYNYAGYLKKFNI